MKKTIVTLGILILLNNLSFGQFSKIPPPPPSPKIHILSPNTGIVGQYDLIEFTAEVPVSTQNSINSFFGNNGYGNTYDASYINPYDPDEISVEATFSFLNEPDMVIYGFYYRDFDYSSTPVVINTTWNENITLNNHWRVRFTPKHIGNWQVKLKVFVNGVLVLLDDIGRNFTCVASNNPGFVKFGANNKYLEYPDGTTIFPAGTNNPWPDQSLDYDNTTYLPYEYTEHRKRIQKLADGGGNYTRIMFTPYGYQIEWEKLNNYDMRQNLMWEFDNLIYQARDNNMLVHISLSQHPEGLTDYPSNPTYPYSWQYNKYKVDLPTVDNPIDFFTEPDAIDAYKKQIRYIIARWGYSPQISTFEIMNEAGLLFNYPDVSWDNAMSSWHQEIASYIKTDLNHPMFVKRICIIKKPNIVLFKL